MTKTALATFGREEVKIKHGENEEKSAGKLVVPSFPDEKMSEERGPSGQEEIESEMTRREKTVNRKRRWKRLTKASTGGLSSLDFNFLDDYEVGAEMLDGTTEPAEDGTSMLEPPSAFMNPSCDLRGSSSPGKFKTTERKFLFESPRRRRIEDTARVLFWGTVPEKDWEVHHKYRENRTCCNMGRVAFVEEVWSTCSATGPSRC